MDDRTAYDWGQMAQVGPSIKRADVRAWLVSSVFLGSLAAFAIGSLVSGDGEVDFIPPPDFAGFDPMRWAADLAAWAGELGQPLVVGLIVLAASLSVVSYLAVRWGWRLWLIRQWRQRRHRR